MVIGVKFGSVSPTSLMEAVGRFLLVVVDSVACPFHKPNGKVVWSWPLVVGTTVWALPSSVVRFLFVRTLTLAFRVLSRNGALGCPF